MAKRRLLRPQSSGKKTGKKKAVETQMKAGQGKQDLGFVEVKISVMLYGTGVAAACQIPCEMNEITDTFSQAWEHVERELAPKMKEVAELAQTLQVR